jgi:drug/metabolite transporter (DMT)-like permease
MESRQDCETQVDPTEAGRESVRLFSNKGGESHLNHPSQKWSGIIAILVAASSYGIVNAVVKLAIQDGLNAAQITMIQLCTGTLLLAALLVGSRFRFHRIAFRTWLKLAAVGIGGLAMAGIAMNIALEHLSTSLAIVLLFQFVWITTGIHAILTRQRPRGLQLLAICFIIVGTVLAVGLRWKDLHQLSGFGVVAGLVAALCYAVFLYFSGQLEPEMNPIYKSLVMISAAIPVMAGILLLTVPGQLLCQPGDWHRIATWAIPLGILSSALPIAAFNWGLVRVSVALGSALSAFELPVAVLGAMFILHESVARMQWLGIGVMLVGILTSELQEKGNYS